MASVAATVDEWENPGFNWKNNKNDEVNLIYVAATRAKRTLSIPAFGKYTGGVYLGALVREMAFVASVAAGLKEMEGYIQFNTFAKVFNRIQTKRNHSIEFARTRICAFLRATEQEMEQFGVAEYDALCASTNITDTNSEDFLFENQNMIRKREQFKELQAQAKRVHKVLFTLPPEFKEKENRLVMPKVDDA